MRKALRRYFRAGHISMTPGLHVRDVVAPRKGADGDPPFPFNLDEKHRAYTYNGSAAIAAVVEDMNLGANDGVLLPAYCCGAELGPFQQAGCEVYFYDIHEDLSVNRTQIESALSAHPHIRLLFITHYFGLAQKELAALAVWCKTKRLSLLEDCAHALYGSTEGSSLGTFGDYAIFSQRKFLPITEGGVVISKRGFLRLSRAGTERAPRVALIDRLAYSVAQHQRARTNDASVLQHLLSITVIALFAIPATMCKVLQRLRLFPDHQWLTPEVEGVDAVDVYHRGVSALSQRTWSHADHDVIIEKRRSNFQHWTRALLNQSQFVPLIKELPAGMCPLYFPVIVSEPARIVERLKDQDIEAFNWWHHVPRELATLPPGDCSVALDLKQKVVALPVHQKIDDRHIAGMARSLLWNDRLDVTTRSS